MNSSVWLQQLGFLKQEIVQKLNETLGRQMVREILGTFDKEIERKDLSATVIAEKEPMIISVDSFRLEQLFINLIENAIKYTERGGIVVRLSRTESLFSARVEDSGIGIARHDLSRIFERFYRGEDPLVLATPGTGLGLANSRTLVEMHHGKIWFTSSGIRGEGSTFAFTLPVYHPEE